MKLTCCWGSVAKMDSEENYASGSAKQDDAEDFQAAYAREMGLNVEGGASNQQQPYQPAQPPAAYNNNVGGNEAWAQSAARDTTQADNKHVTVALQHAPTERSEKYVQELAASLRSSEERYKILQQELISIDAMSYANGRRHAMRQRLDYWNYEDVRAGQRQKGRGAHPGCVIS